MQTATLQMDRGSGGKHPLGLIELIVNQPYQAARLFERDLQNGADPRVVMALVEAAEAVTRMRGLHMTARVAGLKQRLERRISDIRSSAKR
jgi:hypothetical protein